MRKLAIALLLMTLVGCDGCEEYFPVLLAIDGSIETRTAPLSREDVREPGGLPVEWTIRLSDQSGPRRSHEGATVTFELERESQSAGADIELLDESGAVMPGDTSWRLYRDPSMGPVEISVRVRFNGPPIIGSYSVVFTLTGDDNSSSENSTDVNRFRVTIHEHVPLDDPEIDYTPSEFLLDVGVPMAELHPTKNRAITDWIVNPPLPGGLSIDPLTGAISGTPTAVSAPSEHTVTARVEGLEATATLRLEVRTPVRGSPRWVWTAGDHGEVLVSNFVDGSIHPFAFREVSELTHVLDIESTPDGRFVYTLDESGEMRVFAIDPETGLPDGGTTLSEVNEFVVSLHLTGRYLVTNGDSITCWEINALTGRLEFQRRTSSLQNFVTVTVHPTENLAYFANGLHGRIEVVSLPTFFKHEHYDRPQLGQIAVHRDGYLYMLRSDGVIEQYGAPPLSEIAAGAEPLTPLTPPSLPTNLSSAGLAVGADLFLADQPGSFATPGNVHRYVVSASGALQFSRSLTLDTAISPFTLIATTAGTVHVSSRFAFIYNLDAASLAIESRSAVRFRVSGSDYGQNGLAVIAGPPATRATNWVAMLGDGQSDLRTYERVPGSGLVESSAGPVNTDGTADRIVFDLSGQHAYAVDAAGVIDSYSFDATTGKLTHLGTTTVGASTTAFALSPNGLVAYAADGPSLYVFQIDPSTGELSARGFLETSQLSIHKLFYSPEGFLHVQFDDGFIQPWDVQGVLYVDAIHGTDEVVFHPTGWSAYAFDKDAQRVVRWEHDPFAQNTFHFVEQETTDLGGTPKAIAFNARRGRLMVMDAEDEVLRQFGAHASTGILTDLMIPITLPAKPRAFALGASGDRVFVALELPGIAMFDLADLGLGAGAESARVGTAAIPIALAPD